MSANPAKASPVTPEQPLKGKYDRRYRRLRVPHRKGINSRCKPAWLKNLGAKNALDVLQEFDGIVAPALLYQQAYDKKDFRLCWEMRTSVEERLLGKPFVAVNPELAAQSGSVLHEDKRLQVAVGTMIVQAPVIKGKRIRKPLANDSQGLLIEAPSAQSGVTARTTDSKDFVGFNDVD